ncbi:separin-like [Asterias rubens]|uniref:separin-like n=1 Tax=Asterias rubens TaxID=7604 RepID=UPI00145562DE|nr:separin-like [Asterias rubens]
MEGERILQSLKDGTNVGDLVRDLEIYMAPFMRHKTNTSQELASKYGLYALKVLRACVQQMTVLKTGHSTISHIIHIANKSYECINRAKKHTTTVSLSLEKLLFHMMVQGMSKGFMADAMVFARNLHEHLSLCQQDFITDGKGVDNEFDTVCKQAFNQLWKACVDLEHSSKPGTKKHMVVLDVRLQALTFLMLTSYEVSWVVERAHRAMVEFNRVSSNSIEENSQILQFLKTVLDALQEGCGKAKKEENVELSEVLSPMFELCLQLAWCCSRLGTPEEAFIQYEKLQKVVRNKCSKSSETLYSAAVSIITATLHVSVKSSSNDISKPTKKAKSQKAVDLNLIKKQILDAVICTSKAIEKGDPNQAALQCLIEAFEFLKKRFEYLTNQRQEAPTSPSATMVPDELIPAIEAAVSLLIDLLQLQREHMHRNPGDAESASKGKQQRLLLQKAVNRQLASLNLMSVILLHRMKHCKEDIVIEDAGRMAGDALSICQRTLGIIEEVSGGAGGAVSTNEHRWLGTNAYNFGLMCYKKQWYTEGVPLLTLACQQLQRWCVTKEVIDKDKITKVQLFSKYELLVDCQRKAGQHQEAMQTAVGYLWEHASHLADQWTTIVEIFVKAKREAVKSTGDDELRTRTVLDVIQAIEVAIPDEGTSLVSKLLELELSIYKSQRYESTVEQYAVVCDLLGLYGDDKMRLHRAHAHIEQAQLLRDGSLETDCSPVDCCKEAIQLLEDLAQDFLQQQEQQQDTSKDYLVVFDLLATAYFWLYICDSEANQATYIATQLIDSKPVPESVPEATDPTTTSKKHSGQSANDPTTISYTLSAEYLATEPLDRALDIWSDLMVDRCNTSMFNDPVSTCYCLKVAASLCHLADRPIQQIQALSLLIRLAITNSSMDDAILAYCQMTQAVCHIGAVAEAESLLSKAHDLMRESKVDGEDSNGVAVALMITECYVLLGSRKIREFESLLGKLLQLQSNKRRSRQTYLRNASTKHLQSLYLLLPNSQRTQDAAIQRDLIPDDLSPLELRAEAMRLQMGVGRLMLGEGIYSNEQNLHCDGFKHVSAAESGCNDIEFDQWTVMTMVLQSLYEVSSLYLDQGCIREAKSYLKEGLLLADKFMLPRRCVAFLLQLSNLYAQCGQENDCQGTLSKVHVTLHVSNEGSRPGCQDGASVTQEDDDDDDDFIHTKRISISSECSSSRNALLTDTTSSPSLRPQTIKLPAYLGHGLDCFCVSCLDLSLHAQSMRLFLRRAQHLELQGDSTQAMNYHQAVLDHGAWATKKIPSLLSKSCSHIQSCESATKKKGKRKDNRKVDADLTCNIHTELIIEAHISLTVLSLLGGSLAQAEGFIKKALDLANHASIQRSWLQYLDILISLEHEAERTETTTKDLLGSHWEVQSKTKNLRESQTQEEDLAFQFEGLGLGKSSSKPQTQFQDSVFADRMQRPEVSRKLSEKVSELGIFCDMSDSDNSDKTTSTVENCSADVRRGAVKETPKTVSLNTKKGALMFSVRKKKPVNKIIWNDIVTPQADTASLAVFDFDGPSPLKTKKAGTRAKSSAKSKSTRRKVAIQTIDLDSDIDEVFDKEVETIAPKTATKTKRTTTKKSASKVQLDKDSEFLENVDRFIEKVDASKSVRKSRKATEVSVDSTVKTRKVRKTPVNTELLEPKVVVSARPKRGRKPNVETLRSEVMTQVTCDILPDLQLPHLELDSPNVSLPTIGSNNHGSLNLNFEMNTPSKRTEQTSSPVTGITNSFILEDLDEIEIPRAGGGSDSDEPSTAINVRRKTARKPAASRKRATRKGAVEEVEVLRGANVLPIDAKTGTGKMLRKTASARRGSSESSSMQSGSNFESVISALEQIHSSICHLAPTLLYRRVCQLLAMCLSDRHPERATYYLSEACAVTLRHQKLSSLTKKIRKQKKKLDSDNIQSLPDAMATITLDGDSKDGCKEKAGLRHLTEEQGLFSFNRNPSTQGESLDVVQQLQNVLPEGWTVCMMSGVSSSISPAGTLNDSDSLLMCRLSRGCKPLIVNHSMPSTGLGSAAGLVEEFTNILSESKSSVKETDKKAWWTCRQQLDERTQTLTEAMEETLLGQWKGLALGARTNPEDRQRLTQTAEKLKALIETMCKKQVDRQLCQCVLESSNHLSKLQLYSALSSLSGAATGSDQHVSLVSSFRQLIRDWPPATSREPIILILDKQIQQLPWESIPILRDGAVCRMPSLYFILAQLLRSPDATAANRLDPTDAFFVLNPSNDLANTQKTFQKWFEKENNWKGVVARPPTKDEYKSALTDHQLFVFCGHGNGREFLTGDDIQRLNCRATSLLIGCSSGRLHVTGAQEASGMVLNYLVAECPCLVANLWDVTDRDIDRFLEHLLRSWLAGDQSTDRQRSLLDYMSEARKACKLQYLIGASPVVYGLPVYLKR